MKNLKNETNNRTYLALLAVLFLTVSCAGSRIKVLNANGASMTKFHLKKGQKLKELPEVEGMFCAEAFKSGSFGMIDEAIKDAQKKSNADFLTQVSIEREGNCT